jgi:hypothetical protein
MPPSTYHPEAQRPTSAIPAFFREAPLFFGFRILPSGGNERNSSDGRVPHAIWLLGA